MAEYDRKKFYCDLFARNVIVADARLMVPTKFKKIYSFKEKMPSKDFFRPKVLD